RSRVISGVIAFASVLLHSQGPLRPSFSPFWHNLTEPGDYKRERNPRRGTYVVLRWVATSITTSLPTVGSGFPPIKIVAIDMHPQVKGRHQSGHPTLDSCKDRASSMSRKRHPKCQGE